MNYTSKNLEKKPTRSVDLLLAHLKTQGTSATSTLAQVLGVSTEAVRQHLTKLVEQGVIEGESSSQGVGRPKQLWRLTAIGNARFPDTHAQLTVQIIQSIDQLFGQEGLQRIVEHRSAQQLTEYHTQLAPYTALETRVTQLASLRDTEGYMARIEREGADFLLIEDHCPICAAATLCQRFCTAELAQFQALMQGYAQVTREEHLLHDARRCVYRFRAV